jgi:hypothetical protein
MELAPDRVQLQALVLEVLSLRILVPESHLRCKMGLREICCEDGTWIEMAQVPVLRRALALAVLSLRVALPERYGSYCE